MKRAAPDSEPGASSGGGGGDGHRHGRPHGFSDSFSSTTRPHSGGAMVIVSKVQNGNPVLRHLRHVTWRYGEVEPDFVVGAAAAALYISVRYHLLHPSYLIGRLKALTGKYRVRILLAHIDVDDSQAALHSISKLAFTEKWSVVCGWTTAEIARYIETYKVYEGRPADLIQGRTHEDFASKLSSCLTAVRLVNKTDVATLAGSFGTLRQMITAPSHALKLCPGMGEVKAARLADAFQEHFLATK